MQQRGFDMSYLPPITVPEKIILFFIFLVMMGSLSCLLLSSIESNNCIDDNGHKWGKWEIVGRRLLYDNSAVHERTCTKCNFTELE